MKKNNIYINNLNFYWRLKKNFEDKNIVPDSLPFKLDYDPHLRLLIQKRNRKVLEYLDKVYQQAPNIGNIQTNNQWSNLYADDFLKFINSIIAKENPEIKFILEIGCGGCILLESLKKEGFQVKGIDPSPFAIKAGKKRGIKVVQDMFPSKKVEEKFDLIFSSDVLEHTPDPVNFLKAQYKQLNDNGLLILAIPDNTDSIKMGDISILLHQHLNYFDKESLRRTVISAGFGKIHIQRAGYGGSLYCFAKKIQNEKKINLNSDNNYKKFAQFLKRNSNLLIKMMSHISNIIADKNKSLGFYAPVRTLPYIALMNLKWNFRLFDDTIYWHNKFFDGIPLPVENINDLKDKPVTDIIIMSPTFGNIIEKRIIKTLNKEIRIKKLTDFY